MDHQELTNKFEHLFSQEAFIEKLSSTRTAAEVASLFNAEGIELTERDAQQLMDYVCQEGELSEDMLDSVTGGSIYVTLFIIGVGAGLAHGAYQRLKKSWG